MEQNWKKGVKDGIPICLGYLSVSFTFGLLAVSAGLNWWQATFISMTNVTSAGQFAGLNLMIEGGTLLELVISQFFINVRYLLMSVSLTQKVRVTVPLYLVGEAVGVKLGGGVLAQMLRTVDVECLPTDIAEKFEIDVSKMNVNETLFVRDLQLGDKQTLITRGEIPVAVVKGPDDAPAAAGEEKSPEVIKKGKEDDAAKKEAK